MKTTIDIYLSLIAPMNRDITELKTEFNDAKNALVKITQLEMRVPDTINCLMDISSVDNLPSDLEPLWKIHKVYVRQEDYIKFQFTVEYNEQYYEDFADDPRFDHDAFYLNSFLINHVEKRFYDFLMILNISRVGGFHYGLGFSKSSKGFQKLKESNFHAYNLFEYSLEKNGQNLKTWLLKKHGIGI